MARRNSGIPGSVNTEGGIVQDVDRQLGCPSSSGKHSIIILSDRAALKLSQGHSPSAHVGPNSWESQHSPWLSISARMPRGRGSSDGVLAIGVRKMVDHFFAWRGVHLAFIQPRPGWTGAVIRSSLVYAPSEWDSGTLELQKSAA